MCLLIKIKKLIFEFINFKFFGLMGKGDMKTKRGKICRGSYGKLRPRNKKKAAAEPTADSK